MNKTNKNGILCAAFCGTGKTYICEKTDIKAIEIEYWKYKEKGLQKGTAVKCKKYWEHRPTSDFLKKLK